jgi:hypothetical protein
MSNHHDFCMEQALKARADADAATLDNVRDRCLRSEEAWLEMAARALRNDKNREKIAADKAERESALGA